MNVPTCHKCGAELREQWSSKVKIVKAYRIMRDYGMPIEQMARVLNLSVGQIMLMARETDARDFTENRSTT